VITITYEPSISYQDIQSTLDQENIEFPEDNKAQLEKEKMKYRLRVLGTSGVFFILGVGLFITARSFFPSHWLGDITRIAGAVLAVGAPIDFIYKMISSFISASQKDPKKVMQAFINNDGDYSKAFKLLLPSVSRNIPIEVFSEAWQKIN
jgi:hypothetical protein